MQVDIVIRSLNFENPAVGDGGLGSRVAVGGGARGARRLSLYQLEPPHYSSGGRALRRARALQSCESTLSLRRKG